MENDSVGFWSSIRNVILGRRFQGFITLIIILNGITLGLETVPSVMTEVGGILILLDRVFLSIFVVEMLLALATLRLEFFRDTWRVFDLIVISIALVAATGAFSVLRSLRALRVLRLVSGAPRMRAVVGALLAAIPGLGSIVSILLLIFYVAAVMATKLFGSSFPEWFGSIGSSMYTLFQVMTLESWSMGIVRPVMEIYPHAWAIFLPFIMIATFTMLNLFIAVIVNAMQSSAMAREEEQLEKIQEFAGENAAVVHGDLAALRLEIRELKRLLQATQLIASSGTKNTSV